MGRNNRIAFPPLRDIPGEECRHPSDHNAPKDAKPPPFLLKASKGRQLAEELPSLVSFKKRPGPPEPWGLLS